MSTYLAADTKEVVEKGVMGKAAQRGGAAAGGAEVCALGR